ncbi:hypothetical protein AVEN_77612-1 [Araneus ventricosus]|uniref:Uncharacterized protein n=1 Tax=Araneus ventricosus TaxID=182803 RepID=A0A4Y2Q7A6_ARAVE|nr:hypothetical protein AVEN_161674-1 [Araneus ventricosus]GBN58973.1 hypothetical protein AVEN_77612-1 [Araneus ventricosus]
MERTQWSAKIFWANQWLNFAVDGCAIASIAERQMAIRKPPASIKSLNQSGSESIFNPCWRETGERPTVVLQSALIDKFHLPQEDRRTFSN